MQLRFALVYAFASGLDKSELDLDGSGRVLDFRPDSGFERLKLIGDAVLGKLSQCASLSWSHSYTPSRLGLDSPLGSTIACIREDGVLV